MNKTQAKDRAGELYGKLYWHRRGTFPIDNPGAVEANMIIIERMLDAGAFPDETNKNGCTVERHFFADATRYDFDFKLCKASDGWQQFDTEQDAPYFGIWVHLERRQVVTFAEGDVTITTAPDDDALRAELDEMGEFYGPEQRPAFSVIDAETGQLTRFYDERPSL